MREVAFLPALLSDFLQSLTLTFIEPNVLNNNFSVSETFIICLLTSGILSFCYQNQQCIVLKKRDCSLTSFRLRGLSMLVFLNCPLVQLCCNSPSSSNSSSNITFASRLQQINNRTSTWFHPKWSSADPHLRLSQLVSDKTSHLLSGEQKKGRVKSYPKIPQFGFDHKKAIASTLTPQIVAHTPLASPLESWIGMDPESRYLLPMDCLCHFSYD